MRLNSTTKWFLLLGLAGLIITFQNCAPAQFSSTYGPNQIAKMTAQGAEVSLEDSSSGGVMGAGQGGVDEAPPTDVSVPGSPTEDEMSVPIAVAPGRSEEHRQDEGKKEETPAEVPVVVNPPQPIPQPMPQPTPKAEAPVTVPVAGQPSPTPSHQQPELPTEVAIPAPPAACKAVTSVRMMAGQHYHSGDVHIGIVGNALVVDIDLKDGVVMKESHLDIEKSVAGLLKAPGSFPYKSTHSVKVNRHTYTIPLADLKIAAGETIYVKVHASVEPAAGQAGVVINGAETAWAEGIKHGVGWSMYTTLAPQNCAQ